MSSSNSPSSSRSGSPPPEYSHKSHRGGSASCSMDNLPPAETSSSTSLTSFSSLSGSDSDHPSVPKASSSRVKRWKEVYFGLGENKWKESVDHFQHHFGKNVYDEGLHRPGHPEPGFMKSIMSCMDYVATTLGEKVSVDMYLEAHKRACSHFSDWKKTFTGNKHVPGRQRDKGRAEVIGNDAPGMFTKQALSEMHNLRPRINRLQREKPRAGTKARSASGERIGFATQNPSYSLSMTSCTGEESHNIYTIHCVAMKRRRMRHYFHRLRDVYYHEIRTAKSALDKLKAISKFHQHTQRAHMCVDGTQRTAMVLLSKYLTENGFHPALLRRPYDADIFSHESWLAAMYDGLLLWEEDLTLQREDKKSKNKFKLKGEAAASVFSKDELKYLDKIRATLLTPQYVDEAAKKKSAKKSKEGKATKGGGKTDKKAKKATKAKGKSKGKK